MIVKQGEIRSNIKKYFDMAYDGEPIIVPRRENKNVIILSEREYNNMKQLARMEAYYRPIMDISSRQASPAASSGSSPSQVKSYLETTDLKADNMDRLAVFRDFQDDWNGNGAIGFSPGLIEKVMRLVDSLEIQPEIFPSATGTIELEYTNSRRDFMGIEISEGNTAEIFLVLYNGQELFETIDSDNETINERVKKFYE